MRDQRLHRTTLLPVPLDVAFAFFSEAANLERITPPELRFQIKSPLPITMREGARIDYVIRLHGIPMGWRTLISRWEPPFVFEDVQLRGPYAKWEHTHRFRAHGTETVMEDEVIYRLPLWPLSAPVLPLVRRQLRGIFDHRERTIRTLLHELVPSA